MCVPVVPCKDALVYLFPGLNLQGGCLVLELAAGTTPEPSPGDCGTLNRGFQYGRGVDRERGSQKAG